MPASATVLSALPALAAAEQEALTLSIAEQGLLQPIVVSAGPARCGEIADGEARAKACAELGVEGQRVEWPFESDLVFAVFRLTVNLKRRQLSDAARIEIGLQLEPRERELAAKRRAQAAGGRRGEKAVPVNRPEQKGETREQIAAAIGISAATYQRGAKVLAEGSPGLVAAYKGARVSTNGAYTKLKAEKRRAGVAEIARRLREQPPVLPTGRHQVVLIDPPWDLEAELPYPPMSNEQIAALPVPSLLADDALVWLWTTNSFLPDALAISAGWGLEFKTMLTWAKDRLGTGVWLRGQTEHCLLFTRGRPLVELTNESTLLYGPVREHSRKPDEFFDLVDRLCPGSKLELFAREARPGWVAWGAEPDKFSADGSER